MKEEILVKFAEGVRQLVQQCVEDGGSDNFMYIGIACKSDDEEERIAHCYRGDPPALASCLSSVIARLVAANGLPEIWIDEIVSKARRLLNQRRDMTGDESEDE